MTNKVGAHKVGANKVGANKVGAKGQLVIEKRRFPADGVEPTGLP